MRGDGLERRPPVGTRRAAPRNRVSLTAKKRADGLERRPPAGTAARQGRETHASLLSRKRGSETRPCQCKEITSAEPASARRSPPAGPASAGRSLRTQPPGDSAQVTTVHSIRNSPPELTSRSLPWHPDMARKLGRSAGTLCPRPRHPPDDRLRPSLAVPEARRAAPRTRSRRGARSSPESRPVSRGGARRGTDSGCDALKSQGSSHDLPGVSAPSHSGSSSTSSSISSSIRSAIRCAGPRSCRIVQSAA